MNKVQELDNLMKQYIMDAEDDSVLNQIFPLYKTFSKEERKDLYNLLKVRTIDWNHALIDLIQQIHRQSTLTREEINDVIVACFDIINTFYRDLTTSNFSSKEYLARRCIYFLTQFHKDKLTEQELERLKNVVFYIKTNYENNVKSLQNLENLLDE